MLLTSELRTWQRCELAFPAPEGGCNPFDTREVALRCAITRPDGTVIEVAGFAFRPHRLDPVADDPAAIERAIPTGPMEFRVRYVPTLAGAHRVRAWYRFGDGRTAELGETAFTAVASAHPGYVRLSANGRAFAREDGSAFVPIGANICWPSSYGFLPGQKQAALFSMLRKLAAAGGTAFRLWANAPWAHALDWSGEEDAAALRFGELNLAGCAKLDAIMDEAERLGLGVMFCIDAANNWARGDLARSPYGVANGGPCRSTREYFELPEARAMTAEKMKYVAARWGASPAVWCWELWNEVDGCGLDSVDPHQQLLWHQEQATVLRAADPVRHIITTSTGHPLNFAAMWRIPEIEFTQTHHYGYKDGETHIADLLPGHHRSAVEIFRKPHLAGEVGTCWASHQSRWDPGASTLHNVLWSTAIVPQATGPGFMWFWDDYIERRGLWHHFTGIAAFLRGEHWHEVETLPLAIGLTGVAPRPAPAEHLVPTTLSGSDFYQSRFSIGGDGTVAEGLHLIPNTWYGSDRPGCRFAATFVVDYPAEGGFEAVVWGGAGICNGIQSAVTDAGVPVAELRLDGAVALRREVVITKAKGADYSDRLAITVPAGRHEIALRNVGAGAFITGHLRLTGAGIREPRASAQGLRLPGRAWAWIRNRDYQWRTAKAGGTVEPISGLCATLAAMEPGDYEIEWWDTVAGTVLRTERALATTGGLVLEVPAFTNDIAVKCRLRT